jgi:EmrB/QacA subfamily drug resistance transporter
LSRLAIAEFKLAGLLELPEPAAAPFFERRSSYAWFVVATVCMGAFIGQVDASIVQLAMPSFEDVFDAPLSAVSWVAVAYVLAFAAVLPAFARLAEIGGRKTLYLCGFALFGVFSALCGLAPNLPLLIAFRVLQGIGGSMLGANSVVILVAAAGPVRRAKALGIMAAAQAVGLSLGPTLGGVLLATFGWRSIFWVAVPFAIFGAAFGWLIVPKTTAFAKDRRFDASGAALLIPALIALMMTIAEGRAWGPSLPLIACIVAGPILLGLFIWREGKAPAPLIDLRLFGSAAFSAGCIGVLISYAMLYGMFFAMSFALIRGYHDPAFAAGLRLTTVPVTLGLVAPFGGVWSDKRPRLVMVSGMAVCLAATLALTRLLAGTAESLTGVMAALAAYGAGLGLYIAPNNTATIGAAPADKSGVAGGLLNLLRVFGTGIGVAAASTVLGWGMETATGGARTANAPEAALLSAVGGVLLMLSGLGAIGAAAALVRGQPKQAAGRPGPVPLAAPIRRGA